MQDTSGGLVLFLMIFFNFLIFKIKDVFLKQITNNTRILVHVKRVYFIARAVYFIFTDPPLVFSILGGDNRSRCHHLQHQRARGALESDAFGVAGEAGAPCRECRV